MLCICLYLCNMTLHFNVYLPLYPNNGLVILCIQFSWIKKMIQTNMTVCTVRAIYCLYCPLFGYNGSRYIHWNVKSYCLNRFHHRISRPIFAASNHDEKTWSLTIHVVFCMHNIHSYKLCKTTYLWNIAQSSEGIIRFFLRFRGW